MSEQDDIEVRFNVSNFSLNKFHIDPDSFFLRSEDKYGLQEINIDKIDLDFSFDYDMLMIPPVFADKGRFRLRHEDVSLNTVWNLGLNEMNNFFALRMSHILVQI